MMTPFLPLFHELSQGLAAISENRYVSFTTAASTTSAMIAACVKKVRDFFFFCGLFITYADKVEIIFKLFLPCFHRASVLC